jgi:hypothetical protein
MKPANLYALSPSLSSHEDSYLNDIPIIHSNHLTEVYLKGGGDISSESDALAYRTERNR